MASGRIPSIEGGIQPTVVDAKGDLLVATAADTVSRIGVGANDTVLTADSSTATGLKWAAPSGVPVGFVMMFAANAAPTGFLKANGAAISRTTYATLFSAIGTTFGAGDGSTTFLVPDLRGYFPRGWADNGSIDSGRSFGSTQAATSITDDEGDGATVESRVQNSDGNDGTINVNANTPSTNRDVTYKKVRPVNIALLACIKF